MENIVFTNELVRELRKRRAWNLGDRTASAVQKQERLVVSSYDRYHHHGTLYDPLDASPVVSGRVRPYDAFANVNERPSYHSDLKQHVHGMKSRDAKSPSSTIGQRQDGKKDKPSGPDRKKQRGLSAAITKRLKQSTALDGSANIAPGILLPTSVEASAPYQVQARSTHVLLSRLLDPNTRGDVYERTVRRLLRMLMEETIGIGYRRHHEPKNKNRYGPMAVVAGTFQSVLLMREFRTMAPSSPTGSLIIRHHQVDADTTEYRIQWSAAASKQSFAASPILLLVDDVLPHEEDSEHAHSILLCLQTLLFRGVQEYDITIVLMFCSNAFASLLRRRFPQVQMVTLKIVEDKQSHQQWMVTQHRERLRRVCKKQRGQYHH